MSTFPPLLSFNRLLLATKIFPPLYKGGLVKKQQMRWTPKGAHLLLQVRTLLLNRELRHQFERWYSGLKPEVPDADFSGDNELHPHYTLLHLWHTQDALKTTH